MNDLPPRIAIVFKTIFFVIFYKFVISLFRFCFHPLYIHFLSLVKVAKQSMAENSSPHYSLMQDEYKPPALNTRERRRDSLDYAGFVSRYSDQHVGTRWKVKDKRSTVCFNLGKDANEMS